MIRATTKADEAERNKLILEVDVNWLDDFLMEKSEREYITQEEIFMARKLILEELCPKWGDELEEKLEQFANTLRMPEGDIGMPTDFFRKPPF